MSHFFLEIILTSLQNTLISGNCFGFPPILARGSGRSPSKSDVELTIVVKFEWILKNPRTSPPKKLRTHDLRIAMFEFGAVKKCALSRGRLPEALFMVFPLDSKGEEVCKYFTSQKNVE